MCHFVRGDDLILYGLQSSRPGQVDLIERYSNDENWVRSKSFLEDLLKYVERWDKSTEMAMCPTIGEKVQSPGFSLGVTQRPGLAGIHRQSLKAIDPSIILSLSVSAKLHLILSRSNMWGRETIWHALVIRRLSISSKRIHWNKATRRCCVTRSCRKGRVTIGIGW